MYYECIQYTKDATPQQVFNTKQHITKQNKIPIKRDYLKGPIKQEQISRLGEKYFSERYLRFLNLNEKEKICGYLLYKILL